MRDVHRYSSTNISATGAAGSTVGYFLDRNADVLPAFHVILSDLQSNELKHICFDGTCCSLNITRALLTQMAWVWQERL